MKFIELESERLIYRKFNEEDFPVVFEWLSNAEHMKYRRSEPQNESQTHDYIKWAVSNAEAEECRNFVFAAVLKENNLLIGAAMLLHVPDNPGIGWAVHQNYWRQGYGTEIGETMLKLGFDMLKLRRIYAGCNALNIASYKIMERIGMRREAHFIKAQKGNSVLNYEWCDEFQYAILQDEWLAMRRTENERIKER